MTLGSGIAIAAIWAAVAVVGFVHPPSVIVTVVPAALATIMIVLR